MDLSLHLTAVVTMLFSDQVEYENRMEQTIEEEETWPISVEELTKLATESNKLPLSDTSVKIALKTGFATIPDMYNACLRKSISRIMEETKTSFISKGKTLLTNHHRKQDTF